MTDYAKATWIGSPNFTPNRAGHNPNWTPADPGTWIVLHTTVCCEGPARARFLTSAQQASATYLVRLDGGVEQFVAERDAPWTNGTMIGVGSNLDSITIEHEDCGAFNGPRTPALYEASAQLVANISKRRGIPLVHRGAGGGVLRHRECQGASTACCDSLDMDRIIARAVAINAPPPPVDTRPEWQRNYMAAPTTFQLLRGVPIINLVSGAVAGTVPPGALAVAGRTSVLGVGYWVTSYGAQHGTGLRFTDVAAAVVPAAPPVTPPAAQQPSAEVPPATTATPPVVPPADPTPASPQDVAPPPGGWGALLDWLSGLLKALLGRKGGS